MPYPEAKARQESLVATQEKELKWRNQFFSDQSVEWPSNTQVALSSDKAVETLISAFVFGPISDSLPSHPSWQFWQASIIWKGRWWIWVWSIFTCHLTCSCVWRNWRSNGTMCNTSRMFSFDQVGCTSISRVVQLLEDKWLFVKILTNAVFVWHHRW